MFSIRMYKCKAYIYMRKEVTDMLTNHETEKKKVQEEELNEILDYDNDVFFKFALGTEDEDSAFIRNTIIERVTGIHPKESTVLNPNLDPAILRRKKIVLDVHVKDCDGREYDIEMQTTYSKKSEMKRFEFYGARMLSNQVISGGKYQNLLPVFQIIFIDSYAEHSRRLIDSYQMRNEQGAVESSHPLMKRIYIYLPEIDVIARKKGFANMTDFEQLCLVLPSGYLFKNNDSDGILKTDERLVKKVIPKGHQVEKYKKFQDDEDLWSIAMSAQIQAQREKNAIIDSFEEGEVKGLKQGKKELLQELVQMKFGVDAQAWIDKLSIEQLTIVSKKILDCKTFEELKKQIDMF